MNVTHRMSMLSVPTCCAKGSHIAECNRIFILSWAEIKKQVLGERVDVNWYRNKEQASWRKQNWLYYTSEAKGKKIFKFINFARITFFGSRSNKWTKCAKFSRSRLLSFPSLPHHHVTSTILCEFPFLLFQGLIDVKSYHSFFFWETFFISEKVCQKVKGKVGGSSWNIFWVFRSRQEKEIIAQFLWDAKIVGNKICGFSINISCCSFKLTNLFLKCWGSIGKTALYN